MTACDAAEDGSLIPLKSLVERVRASKLHPDQQITVAAVYGVPAAHPGTDYRITQLRVGQQQQLEYDSSCASQLGDALLALRISRFVDTFGIAGTSEDLCVNDLAPVLKRIGQTIAHRLTSVCVPAPVGVCQVTAGQTPLAGCVAGGPRPCWTIDDELRCPASSSELTLEGAGALPAGTRVTAVCGGANR
jgi:hypothetical protein